MNSLIVIFLLCLFDFIICDEVECTPLISNPSSDIIYLFQEYGRYNNHHQLNENFKKMFGPLDVLNIEIIPYNEPKCIINEMIQHAENGISVINLKAKDFQNYNWNRLTNALAYIEYNKKIEEVGEPVEVCNLNKTMTNNEGYEICTFITVEPSIYTIKLASNIIEKKNDKMFKAVLDFEGFIPLKVIDCNSPTRGFNGKDLEVISTLVTLKNTCGLEEDVFVALAPKVKDIKVPLVPTDTPIIFYDESYLSTITKDYFKNAIVVGVNTENIKTGFLFFLQKMEWQRIAILTDDSDVNRKFEEQLTPYLRENGIFLISETCMTKVCNFDKFTKNLKELQIKVIIANVEEENFEKLKNSASLLYNRKWIVREWSKDVVRDANRALGDIFSMTSLPIDKHTVALKAVQNIMKSHKYCIYCNYTKSDVAQHLKKILPSKTSFQFTKVTLSEYLNVGSITFDTKGKIIKSNFTYPYLKQMSDGVVNCALQTGMIFNKCDDMNLLLLLMIVAVFFVTILGIVYFFQSPIVSYQRFP